MLGFPAIEQETEMKTKSLMAAFGIVVMTAVSAQACAKHDHSQQAMSCAEGTVWDAETETCTPLTSS